MTITFVKPNYQEAGETLLIRVIEVPTDLSVFVPEVNSDVDHPFEYIVPYGEVLNITVFYNDTDASEGITGGLVGAQLNLSSIYGPTRALSSFEMVSLGGGYYYFLFNTLDSWLFEQAVGDPGPQTSPFRLTLILDLENRSHASQVIDIWIIELPTSIEIVEMNTNLLYGDTGRLVVMYLDAWPGHPEGTLISGASFTLDIDTAVTELLGFSDPYEDPARPGYYVVEYTAASPFIGTDTGVSDVTFMLSIANTEPQLVTLRVVVQPTQTAQLLTTAFSYGLPLAFVVIFLLVGYIRVWSVPKHLRRINAMIKDLRKGKIPKPVSDAQSRQELIADLFNDTFAGLSIKRTPDQMPPDSIPIEVPEMGELLVQLSILTKLSPEELDDFKADIAKMRISEQAAFVREVIMQEAIRAARREGKTVDEILEELRAQSSRRLGDEEDEILPDTEDEVHEEPVILRPDDVDSPRYLVKDAPDEDMSFSSDYLSPFEIEELQVELTRRGIPLQEIDIILEQARTLPRDLVEELIRSIGEEED